jgi:hypothetical protein
MGGTGRRRSCISPPSQPIPSRLVHKSVHKYRPLTTISETYAIARTSLGWSSCHRRPATGERGRRHGPRWSTLLSDRPWAMAPGLLGLPGPMATGWAGFHLNHPPTSSRQRRPSWSPRSAGGAGEEIAWYSSVLLDRLACANLDRSDRQEFSWPIYITLIVSNGTNFKLLLKVLGLKETGHSYQRDLLQE